MALVTNNTVKMEWEKALWLQTKGKGSVEGAFIFAGKEYNSTVYGNICVGFTSSVCFLFTTEAEPTEADDFWSGAEMKDTAKENMSDFPLAFEGTIVLNDIGTSDFNDELLEKYGLAVHKEDLVARMKDLLQYDTPDED